MKSSDDLNASVQSIPAAIRVLHWLQALASLGLMFSGFTIYNAAPVFSFTFPAQITFGGHLTEALRWHFTLMWVFTLSGILLFLTRTLMKSTPSVCPRSIKHLLQEGRKLLTKKSIHTEGSYNEFQRWIYSIVYANLLLLFISGLCLWKPVQLSHLTTLLGGFEVCRSIHFFAMCILAAFVLIHITMALLVPKVFLSMLLGLRSKSSGDHHASHH